VFSCDFGGGIEIEKTKINLGNQKKFKKKLFLGDFLFFKKGRF
jgi:hypothetical protein